MIVPENLLFLSLGHFEHRSVDQLHICGEITFETEMDAFKQTKIYSVHNRCYSQI